MCTVVITVEPRLSDSRLSVPGLIRILKLIIKHMIHHLLFTEGSLSKEVTKRVQLFAGKALQSKHVTKLT